VRQGQRAAVAQRALMPGSQVSARRRSGPEITAGNRSSPFESRSHGQRLNRLTVTAEDSEMLYLQQVAFQSNQQLSNRAVPPRSRNL